MIPNTTLRQISIKLVSLAAFLMLQTCFISIYAQGLNKLRFTTEFSSMFPVGKEIRANIQYKPGFTINYPKKARYINPVYCLEFGPDYEIVRKLTISVTGGIAVAQGERDPLTSKQYFNRVMFPVKANFGYNGNIGKSFGFVPRVKVGYQFSKAQFGNTFEGFLYEQSGGLTLAIDFSLIKNLGKYSPSLFVGYELNKIQNDVSLGWVDGYDYHDKYQFTTSYHFIKMGIGIKY